MRAIPFFKTGGMIETMRSYHDPRPENRELFLKKGRKVQQHLLIKESRNSNII